jgi:hypothetical protein
MFGLVSSNLFLIFLTFSLGAGFYFSISFFLRCSFKTHDSFLFRLISPRKTIRVLISCLNYILIAIALIIYLCFMLNLGETYQYSEWYKRSFGPFGDGFPFVLIFFLLLGFFIRSRCMTYLALIALIFTGGRMVLLSALVGLLFLYFFRPYIFNRFNVFRMILISLLFYFVSLALSNYYFSTSINIPITNDTEAMVLKKGHQYPSGCETIGSCFETQILRAAKSRVASSIVGAWMIEQGGFPGKLYPGTPEKFAEFLQTHHLPNLLSERNFMRLNDIFDLTSTDFALVTAIEQPYLNFGSGYGLIGLIIIFGFFTFTAVLAFKNLALCADRSLWQSLSIFFILLVFINQSQQWIQSGSVLLFFSGLSSAHIWSTQLSFMSRHKSVDNN